MRRKPYTTRGIARVPCAKCGAPSRFQWQCCANGNLWQGLCAECDIALNSAVLHFFRPRGWKSKLRSYVAQVRAAA